MAYHHWAGWIQARAEPLKIKQARELVKTYYDEKSAKEAEEGFDKIFIKKEVPDEIPEHKINKSEINILDLILEVNFAPSKGEARRLVVQGGVTIDGEKVDDIKTTIKFDKEKILKVGKRKFVKIKT